MLAELQGGGILLQLIWSGLIGSALGVRGSLLRRGDSCGGLCIKCRRTCRLLADHISPRILRLLHLVAYILVQEISEGKLGVPPAAACKPLEIRDGHPVEPLFGAHHVEDEYTARDKPDEDEKQHCKSDNAAETAVLVSGVRASGTRLRHGPLYWFRSQIPDDAADLIGVHVGRRADNGETACLLVKRDDVVMVGIRS